jgi:hypothetical protein
MPPPHFTQYEFDRWPLRSLCHAVVDGTRRIRIARCGACVHHQHRRRKARRDRTERHAGLETTCGGRRLYLGCEHDLPECDVAFSHFDAHGRGSDKHHVLWNAWKPRKGVVGVPTIFAEAKRAGFSTAMLVGKEKFRHLVQPGTLDQFEFGPAEPHKSSTVLSRIVAKGAARYILEHKPNLCFIHFTDPDNTGHKYGWGSPQQIKAFSEVDTALGEIVKAIEAAGISPESVLIITADHGGHGKTHGGKKPEDMLIPWIAWGKDVNRGLTITGPVMTCDTAATALWLLGVPIPEAFAGKPVTSAFTSQRDQLAPVAGGARDGTGLGL